MRAPLDRLVLATKLLDLNESPKAVLALTPDPPHLSKVESAVVFLKEVKIT